MGFFRVWQRFAKGKIHLGFSICCLELPTVVFNSHTIMHKLTVKLEVVLYMAPTTRLAVRTGPRH